MSYDPNKCEERKGPLPSDVVLNGAIINFVDGTIKDFVDEKYLNKWRSLDQPAVNFLIECQGHQINEMFPYSLEDGKVIYSPNSKLGKFIKKYGTSPKPGVAIKIETDGNGYGHIKVD